LFFNNFYGLQINGKYFDFEKFLEMVTTYTPRVVGAVLTLIIG